MLRARGRSNIMKFIVTFKNPDALDWSLEDYPEGNREEMKKFAERWIEHGEYVDIEFDTKKGTAIVLRKNR